MILLSMTPVLVTIERERERETEREHSTRIIL